jgi:hypothetical protein
MFNVSSVINGSPHQWTAEATQRFAQDAAMSSSNLLKVIADPVFIQRLSDEAVNAALQPTLDKFNRQYNKAADGVVSTRTIRSDRTITNTDEVEITVGRTNQEFFDSFGQADNWARNYYRFDKDAYDILPEGDGKFKIIITKNIDETDPAIRNQLDIETRGQDSATLTQAYGSFLRSNDDVVSTKAATNAMTGVQGAGFMIKAIKDEVKRIGRLPRQSAADLEDFLTAQRSHVDPNTGQQGMFSGTLGNFQSDWRAYHGRMPTEKEAQHYFAYERINNLDYIVRNF